VKKAIVFIVGIMLPLRLLAAELTAGQAVSQLGETTTVCGIVVSAKYSVRTKVSQPFST
jgi:hypothetical protein